MFIECYCCSNICEDVDTGPTESDAHLCEMTCRTSEYCKFDQYSHCKFLL